MVLLGLRCLSVTPGRGPDGEGCGSEAQGEVRAGDLEDSSQHTMILLQGKGRKKERARKGLGALWCSC